MTRCRARKVSTWKKWNTHPWDQMYLKTPTDSHQNQPLMYRKYTISSHGSVITQAPRKTQWRKNLEENNKKQTIDRISKNIPMLHMKCSLMIFVSLIWGEISLKLSDLPMLETPNPTTVDPQVIRDWPEMQVSCARKKKTLSHNKSDSLVSELSETEMDRKNYIAFLIIRPHLATKAAFVEVPGSIH